MSAASALAFVVGVDAGTTAVGVFGVLLVLGGITAHLRALTRLHHHHRFLQGRVIDQEAELLRLRTQRPHLNASPPP